MNKIIVREWDYTCGDGCCYEYGVAVTVNGNEVLTHSDINEHDLKVVLDALGVECEIEYANERGYNN